MNVGRMFVALIFFLMENGYYGWNPMPGSDSELICDGICAVLVALSVKP